MREEELRNKIIYRHLATPESLCQRPLELSEIKKMDSLVYRYHELFNADNLESAINKPQQVAAGREQAQKNRARAWWESLKDESQRPQRIAEIEEIASEFQRRYPQFASIEENTVQLVNLIKSRGEIFSLESVISAYQHLCSQGVILVTPENCGLDGSEAVKGKMLTSIQGWERVLEPVHQLSDEEKEQQRILNLSSADYKREFMPADDTLPPIIQKRIEADILGFCKSHPEYDNENGTVGRDILLDWIREHGMPINRDSLEASFKANFEKLKAADCIWDSAPGIPVRAPGGVSTLVDHRKPPIPANERSVVIKEPESAKRFSLQEILTWDSATMLRMMQQFPDLQNQIDNM